MRSRAYMLEGYASEVRGERLFVTYNNLVSEIVV